MNLDPFLQSLGFYEPAGIDAVERRFIEVVKEHIQKASLHYDEAEVFGDEKFMRKIYGDFFAYTTSWLSSESRLQKPSSSPEAVKIKKQASALLEELQSHMTDFACCYMHINRFMTLLREEIRSEEARLGGTSIVGTKWTSDAGTIIARNKQKKKHLLETNSRFSEARIILEGLTPHFDTMRQSLVKMHGAEKTDALQRSIVASLRVKEFKRARKAMDDILALPRKFTVDQKSSEQALNEFSAAALHIVDVCEEHQDTLSSHENRLYLKPIETDQAYNAQIRELKKIKDFLSKYYMPYMQYKLDMLMHLKDKLLVNGSIENLMTLYRQMITGMLNPLDDIKSVRTYESQVIDKIKYLLSGQFQEVPVILKRAEETVKEFRTGAEEFRDVENIDVTEIDIAAFVDEKVTTGSLS